jgi:hypothetical protein
MAGKVAAVLGDVCHGSLHSNLGILTPQSRPIPTFQESHTMPFTTDQYHFAGQSIRASYIEKKSYDESSIIIFREALDNVVWRAFRSFSASNYEALRGLLLAIDRGESALSKTEGPGLLFETIFRANDEPLSVEEQNELIEHLLDNRIDASA